MSAHDADTLGPDWTNSGGGAQALWTAQPLGQPLMVYGRMEGDFDPAKCPQAKLTSTTVCASCGVGFEAGDNVQADLAIPPAEATWRHGTCVPPATIPAGATRGFGILSAGGSQ